LDDLSRDGNSSINSNNNYYNYSSNSGNNNWRVGSVNGGLASRNSDRENVREHRSSSSLARPMRPKSRQIHPTDIDGERESLSSMPEEMTRGGTNTPRSAGVADTHFMQSSVLTNEGYDDDSETPRVMTRPSGRHIVRNDPPSQRETPRGYLEDVSLTQGNVHSDNQSLSLASESVLSRSGSASSLLSAAYPDNDNDPNPEQVKVVTKREGSPSNSLEESYDGDTSLSVYRWARWCTQRCLSMDPCNYLLPREKQVKKCSCQIESLLPLMMVWDVLVAVIPLK